MTMQPDPFIPAPISAAERARWTPDAMEEARTICSRWGFALHAVVGVDAIPPGGLAEAALHRIGALIGVDRAAVVIFGPEQGKAWMHRPNAGLAFAGRSPAALVQEDGLLGLLAVRAVLEGWRVGCFGPIPADAPAGPPMRYRVAPS